ncbi:MAG TPA: Ig-like domain-containing protein [Steroidobacteraceae bacterium]
MDFHSAKTFLRALPPTRHPALTQLAAGAAALLACASLHAQTVPVEQFGLTAVNANGNALYNVTVTPNTPANTGALITGTSVLNTDAGAQGSFFAVARVPNSVTSAMDLIVADAEHGRILRYPGPGPASYAVSTPIFTWSHPGSGPRYPIGLSSDVAGNVYVISEGVPFDLAPSLWVLPFNATTGAYGAPILIDNTCGIVTEVLVATTAATPVGAAAPAWNVGDVLVLSNDIFNARVMVYSQAAIQGVLANPSKPLNSPTSTAIGPALLRGTLPIGMGIWPSDATHGVSLLLSTLGGRIMRFDSGSGAMAADFASGLGIGLERIKVGTYSTLTYAFVSQFTPGRGKILQLGAPPASGANLPLASLSTGNKDPQGLATSNSGSVPVTACVAPSACAPLGPELTTQLSGAGSVPTTAPLLEESCVVKSDPRVTVVGTTWSCAGGNLDVANYCPGFPSTVLPGTMCGHSGPTGAGFVVVKSTAKTVDQNANNTFFQHTVDPNVPLPGPLNLTCPQLEVFAWAPRSDLPSIEGTIPEGGPAPGSNYFMDLSGFCDDGGGHSHILSMMAYGLGLNSAPSGMANGLPGFVTDKFTNLTSTISAASAQIDPSVGATVQGYVTQAQTFFNGGVAESASNGYSCAMNSLASADAYVRANLPAFSGLAPPGNPNPAGDVDGRLANLFLPIDLFFLSQPANAEWPTNNVPPCVTLTPTPATVILSSTSAAAATLTWGPAATAYPLSFPPTQCSITASDGTFQMMPGSLTGSGSVSTGTLTKLGTYSAQLMCSAAAGNNITSFTQAMVKVIALASINVTPPGPQVAAGGTAQLTATGTYTDGSTQNLSPAATWVTSAPSVATVAAGLVSCSASATAGGSATISATGATATGTTTGSTTVTCLAPVLQSITIAPTQLTLPTGGTAQLMATGNFSSGPGQPLTNNVQWSSSVSSVATVSAMGLVTCTAGATMNGSSTITATSGTISASVGVTCQAPQLKYIRIMPSRECEIRAGGKIQLTAIGTYASGVTKNLTSSASWTSSAPSVATVAAGLVSCKAPHSYYDGHASISASAGSVSGSTNVTCEGFGR